MYCNTESFRKRKFGEVHSSILDADQLAQLEQLHTLRRYILYCSEVPSNCEAIKIALKALDYEIEKKKGDKGHDFFMESKDMTLAKMHNGSLENTTEEVWSAQTADDQSSTHLGQSLSEASVRSISLANIQITSPVSAIAVAINGALVSDILRFQCTGIPELNSNTKKENEVETTRQLPKGKFIPVNWDSKSNSHVALSYKKKGYGTAVLIVSLVSDIKKQIQIYFGPLSHENITPLLLFSPDKYINLKSLESSPYSSSVKDGTHPSLHYINLSILLTQFSKYADLGQIYLEEFSKKVDLKAVSSFEGNRSFSSLNQLKQPNGSQRIARKKWANEEHWIQFRLNGKGHVMCNLSEMVRCGFLEHKRKKAEGGGYDKDMNNLSVSKIKHIRKQCMYCSETVKIDGKLMKRSRFKGAEGKRRSARKPYKGCLLCKVPLCDTSPSNDGNHMSCNERWHSVKHLP